MKTFRGNSGDGLHQQNFIDAVRAQDASLLKAEVEVGHYSTGWCNLANIAFRAGGPFSRTGAQQVAREAEQWAPVVLGLAQALQAHGTTMDEASVKLSAMLEVDVERGVFSGPHADTANPFLKREYRDPFVVPELA
jgi:hypothetical protein